MKIAHIHWTLGTGGIENMLADIANIQVETEDVYIFIINNWVEEDIVKKISSKVHLILLNRKPGTGVIKTVFRMNYYLYKFRPDIIHTHAFGEIKFVWYPCPRVRTIHSTKQDCSEYHKYKQLFSISNAVYETTKKQGFDSIVVLNGIKTKSICTNKTNVWRDGNFHIVQIGRLDIDIKGQDITLKALHYVVNHGSKNVKLHFIGEGDSLQFLKKEIKLFELDDYVIFEGRKSQQEVYNNLCNYDLFVMSSRYEGFGLTVAEAMVAAVPVLVCDIEGPMECICNGEFGEHFRSQDYKDLGKKIVSIMNNGVPPETIEKARNYAIQKFDVKQTAQLYLNYYQKTLSTK